MKIVHVTSFFQKGLGYQENCLAPAQARLGHEVAILTSDRMPAEASLMDTARRPQEATGTAPARERIDGVELVRLPTAWRWRKHNWVCLEGLWEEVMAQRPDIIHAHNVVTIPTWQVLAGNRRRRYPLVLDDHNNYFNIEPYTLSKKLFYAAFRHVLRPLWIDSVGRVMPASHEVRTLIRKEFGIDESRTTLVHLGADPERFRRRPEQGLAVRARLGIPSDAIVIVNAGKITPNKDSHVLLRAMGPVAAREPRARLLMIGNAPPDYRAELERLIAGHNLATHVTWVPFADNADLPDFYSAGDVGVWPGDWSVTVLEAAGCALPLVLPDRPYAYYSLRNHNGLTFARGDSQALAEALLQLVTDATLRTAMGLRSRDLIEDDLNWDAIARQTIEIYQQVIGECQRGRQA
jgi:glycosyltransferase involved in cell wall biosynthesis